MSMIEDGGGVIQKPEYRGQEITALDETLTTYLSAIW